MKREHLPQREGGRLQALVQRATAFLTRELWTIDLGTLSRFKSWLLKTVRIGLLAGNGFVQDRCLLRSSALTYITVLSIAIIETP